MLKFVLTMFFIITTFIGCRSEKSDFPKSPQTAYKVVHYNTNVSISPAKNRFSALCKIDLQTKKEYPRLVYFLIHKKIQIKSLKLKTHSNSQISHNVDYQFFPSTFPHLKKVALNVNKVIPPNYKSGLTLIFTYNGTFRESKKENATTNSEIIVNKKGIYLSENGGWIPISFQLSKYKLTATISAPYQVVSEGKESSETFDGKNRFSFVNHNKMSGISLVASRYQVKKFSHKGIVIGTYFSKKNSSLSDTYIAYSKKYLDLYSNLLGPYPYSKLYIVENYLQTGYGMPSYTLIGDRVLRLPFIVKTSLGHEILHNWWGNSVFIDPDGSNWCEGLTTYLADYYYKEKSSLKEAIRYRKNINKTFTLYVNDKNDFPLSQFVNRTNRASSSIGYGKTMMLFHQLRVLIGDKHFFKSLKSLYKKYQFRYLNWKQIEKHFEKVSRKELKWFFKQWIHRKGAPELSLKRVVSKKWEKKYKLTFTLSQKGKPYELVVPVYYETKNKKVHFQHFMSNKEYSYTIVSKSPVQVLKIDPNYDIFRRLNEKEIPPSVSLIYSDRGSKYLLTSSKSRVEVVKEIESVLNAKETKSKIDANNKALIIIGDFEKHLRENKIQLPPQIKLSKSSFKINGKKYKSPEYTLIVVLKNQKSGKAILIAYNNKNKFPQHLFRRLSHYQNESYMLFKGSRVIDRGEFEIADHPLTWKITGDTR